MALPPSDQPDDALQPGGDLVPVNSVEQADLSTASRYSPERNVVESLRLIRADGPIVETLACFQMLAQR